MSTPRQARNLRRKNEILVNEHLELLQQKAKKDSNDTGGCRMLPGARFAQWMIQTDQIIFGCTMELHGIIQEIVSHVRHSIDLYPSMHTLGRSIQSLHSSLLARKPRFSS
jgi:hypothetical protein